jgi:hypothetical protein
MTEFRIKKIETGFVVEGEWDRNYSHRKEWAFLDWSAVLDWMKANEPVFVKNEEPKQTAAVAVSSVA